MSWFWIGVCIAAVAAVALVVLAVVGLYGVAVCTTAAEDEGEEDIFYRVDK